MGFLDSLLGKSDGGSQAPGPERGSTSPFKTTLSFSSLRLSANKRNSVNLIVRVTNVSGARQLVSVDASLPKASQLGFDAACINKTIEKRAGELNPEESLDIPIEIFASNQTRAGNYGVDVTVFSHYLGYDKVLSYMKKGTSLRVV